MNSKEYGPRVGTALAAVRQLHSDASKLLQECDTRIAPGRESMFGAYATQDLTYSYRTEFWMAEAVFRYYRTDVPDWVHGVTVCFFDRAGRISEPIIIVGSLRYPPVTEGNSACQAWDLWDCYFESKPRPDFDMLAQMMNLANGRILEARILVRRLYDLQSFDDVEAMFRNASAPSPAK